MSSSIIITGTNVVNQNNNEFVFNFPSTVSLTNCEIAVQSIQLFYSWFNISQTAYNNTTFQYQWYNNTTETYDSFNVVLPDGLWSIADINAYLQYTMINNGQYAIDSSTGQNIYYITLELNAVLYAVQLNTFPVPTTAPAGVEFQFTAPTTTFNPIVIFPANFNKIVGFAPNFTSTESTAGTNLSFTSSIAPQVQPSPTLLLSCNAVFNKFSTPPNILASITPNVDVGASYYIQFYPQYTTLVGGQYSSLRLAWMNTSFQAIPLQDPTCCIVLLIREKQNLIQK
jgi:hypothetical protein